MGAGWGILGAGSVSLLTLLLTGCTSGCSSQQSKAQAEPTELADDTQSPPPASPTSSEPKAESYADAIRAGSYETAARLLDALPESERVTPEIRYARAHVALELNDVEGALRHVDELETEHPSFAGEARSIRLASAKRSLDVTLIETFLSKAERSGTSNSALSNRLVLAEAYRHGSSLNEALKLTEEVLSLLTKRKKPGKREHALEGSTRALRAQLFVNLDRERDAAREYRWLATKGALLPEGVDADDKAEQLDPKRPLSASARLERARTFSDAGLAELTDRELRRMSAAPGGKPAQAEQDAILAWALYLSRTDYEKAASLFAAAAASGGKDRKRLLYYEARALSRAHRDAEAIARYKKLAPLGGSYGEHASYRGPKLELIDGQFDAAITGYQSYLQRFKSGTHRDEAVYDLAIAQLAAGKYQQAAKGLAALHKQSKGRRDQARLLQLWGTALLLGGQKDSGITKLKQVIEDRPLSLPALLAEARLKQVDSAVPPRIPPALSDSESPQALQLELPDKVWRLHRVGLDTEAESALRRSESTLKQRYGSRSGEALCRLYGLLDSGKRRYQVAQTAAQWSRLAVAPSATTDWQWQCIYPRPFESTVKKQSARHRVPVAFIYGVMRQESAFRPAVVSPAKAVGLMQIIPPTASRIAEELHADFVPEMMSRPPVNIRFGTYYLRRLLDIFDGRPELVAASYNAGPHAVSRWLEGGEGLALDVFIARIPYRETRNYVYRVMGNYARYAYQQDPSSVPQPALTIPSGLSAPDDAY